MQLNTSVLAKKAIDAALKSDWQAAIKINTEILEKNPKSIDAKLRLGRAFMQKKEFKNAIKLFGEVLKVDPINQIAQKNLKLAKEKKGNQNNHNVDAKSLIKEPGTSTQADIILNNNRLSVLDFSPGEPLKLKIKKRSIDVLKINGNSVSKIGTIEEKKLVTRINLASSKRSIKSISFLNGNDSRITILIKCDIPVFKADKQDTKPYIKKGSIEEPEIQIDTINTN
jgi:tetratricopeptide (TPR) repeat protein